MGITRPGWASETDSGRLDRGPWSGQRQAFPAPIP
jgi:hypothetical protein